MGDMAEVLELYGPQLEDFRQQLFDLYNEKAEILSEREILRFKYLTNWATKFKTALKKFEYGVLSSGNPALIQAANILIGMSNWYYNVPLVTMSNEPVQFTLFNVQNSIAGGYLHLFNISDSPYKVVTLFSSPEDLLKTEWMQLQYTPYYIANKDSIDVYITQFSDMFAKSYSQIDYKNIVPGITEIVIQQMNTPPSERETLISSLTQFYNEAGIEQVLDEGNDLYKKLLFKTKKMFDNAYAILYVEDSIKAFINSYQGLDSTLASITISDILTELQDFSKLQSAQQIQATQVTAPTVTPTIPATPTAPPKSKKGLLIAAAAAAGLYFVTKE